MRYVSINSVPNLSTGSVMRQVTEERRALGDECWCMWGRGRPAENDHEFNFGSKPEFYLDVLQTRLDGRAGFHSETVTHRLLKKLDEIQPDVVHLHNLHGYYINVEMLFDWLVAHDSVHVKWTLHDCWAFTGHCAYFTFADCKQWQYQCAQSDACPQLSSYPKTISKSSCKWNYEHKRCVFTRLPKERMMLVTPSHWLEGLVKQSFLSKYSVEVRYNTINTDVFKPTRSDFRGRYGIDKRFMVLGVASPWSKRKGLDDFIRLARELDSEQCAIVLVGLSDKQMNSVESQVKALPKKESSTVGVKACMSADTSRNSNVVGDFNFGTTELHTCSRPLAAGDMAFSRETNSRQSTTTLYEMSNLDSRIVKTPGGGLIILLARTDSQKQLAAIYTAADVLFNPTREDNYPTVNIEAQCCETVVLTYDVGGCRETLTMDGSKAVSGYSDAVEFLMLAIENTN